ncbi:ubiquitin protein ligase 6 [Striga asiatica]|uniref:Ubiquitin protein ligase 6 n=1 Tax=Striga asiatica TaxID=4170 RepID=A0A5A7PUD0_STRAF|nr:ubiquitin protein ligase 6 [Striga asiatica]
MDGKLAVERRRLWHSERAEVAAVLWNGQRWAEMAELGRFDLNSESAEMVGVSDGRRYGGDRRQWAALRREFLGGWLLADWLPRHIGGLRRHRTAVLLRSESPAISAP